MDTLYVLSWLFLSQAIFLFHSFCFHNFSPPLRKILAEPLYIGMRFHLYIFFTMFCVHLFVFLFIMLIWSPTVVSQHLSKNDKRGWLTRWPPRSFANSVWHSAPLCLHWSAIMPLFSFALMFANMVGLLHAMAFMVLLLVGEVIWNNKPMFRSFPTTPLMRWRFQHTCPFRGCLRHSPKGKKSNN